MENTIELKDLVGLRMLSGVQEEYGKLPSPYYKDETYDGNSISFILDGITYSAFEDDNDGYRSAMSELVISDSEVKNTFAAIQVFGVMVDKNGCNDSDFIRFYDVKTGLIILEVGTDNTDDYYPSFVCSFTPKNLSINS